MDRLPRARARLPIVSRRYQIANVLGGEFHSASPPAARPGADHRTDSLARLFQISTHRVKPPGERLSKQPSRASPTAHFSHPGPPAVEKSAGFPQPTVVCTHFSTAFPHRGPIGGRKTRRQTADRRRIRACDGRSSAKDALIPGFLHSFDVLRPVTIEAGEQRIAAVENSARFVEKAPRSGK